MSTHTDTCSYKTCWESTRAKCQQWSAPGKEEETQGLGLGGPTSSPPVSPPLHSEHVGPRAWKASSAIIFSPMFSYVKSGAAERVTSARLCVPPVLWGQGGWGVGSGSCHSEEQGPRPHKELFDGRGRAGVRAGPGQAPREPTP